MVLQFKIRKTEGMTLANPSLVLQLLYKPSELPWWTAIDSKLNFVHVNLVYMKANWVYTFCKKEIF